MFICEGEIVGMNTYEKDGKSNFYAQVIYQSKMNSYTGKRACSCKVSQNYKIGSKVEVADDFRFPSIIER